MLPLQRLTYNRDLLFLEASSVSGTVADALYVFKCVMLRTPLKHFSIILHMSKSEAQKDVQT